MPCCNYMRHFWCKDLPIVDYKDGEGNEYCIFHAPRGKKGISLKEFNGLVFERINEAKEICNLSGTVFEGDITFGGFHEKFLPSIDFTLAIFSGKTSFSKVTFRGKTMFPYAKFLEGSDFNGAGFLGYANFAITEFSEIANFAATRFSEEASFHKAEFCKKAYFSGTEFKGKVNFSEAKFSENAYFSGAKFSGELNFLHATFSKETNFSNATFKKETSFYEAIFSDDADFYEATFSELAEFLSTKFSGDATFFKTTFNGWTNFTDTTFSKWANFSKATFNKKVSFHGTSFSGGAYFLGDTFFEEGDFIGLNIKEEVKFEKTYIKKVSFLDTDLKKVDFINCVWPKKFGRKVLYDEIELLKNMGGNKNFKEEIKKVEILYRSLKQKYKEEHNEFEVSNWHYGEKEMQRIGSTWKSFSFYLLHLYRLSSGYGERPVRSGLVLFLLIIASSILFGLTGIKPADNNDVIKINEWLDIWKFDYLKATIEYATFESKPTFIPENWLLKTAAKLLIPLQATLFALAL